METEEDGRLHPRTRTIADLLNEPDQIHSTSATSPSRGTSTGGGRVAPAPASDEAIEALKDVDVAATTADDVDQRPPECAICLHHGTAAAGWKEMPCGHRFHGGCLEKWLRAHGTCPMCRHQMPTTTAAPPAEDEEEVEEEEDEEEAGGGPPPLELRVVLAYSGGGSGGVAASASTRRRLLAWSTTI